jgi:hypothetical protein
MNDNAIRRKAVPAFRRGLTANAILERAETLPEQRYAVKEYFPIAATRLLIFSTAS